ncbi:MAG: GNAT family N-acetyltransferase [Streptosporangiales bacterium]|nr:GNAT family N-acetyltransferase [Streptosporangiales bacterium]
MPFFHAVAGAGLDRALAMPVGEPVWALDGERYRAEAALRQYRPEWTWVAEDQGRVLARAIWWGQGDSVHPLVLDCLATDDGVADRAGLAAELLTAANRAFREAGAPRPPQYNIMRLPGGWRADPQVAGAVAWRCDAAGRAGLTERTERLQYEWAPEAGVPEPSGRLEFRPEPDDEVFLDAFVRVAAGSLDAQTRAGEAADGAEATARAALAFYLDRPGKREWWRLAYTPDGALAGLAVPSATPYARNVGYLGVVPELRGRGLVSDILAEITRFQAAYGAERITATTDVDNRPMAAAFERAGYRNTETRLILSAPEGHGA